MKQHTREELLKALEDNLSRYYLVSFQEANEEQMYGALSTTIRDLLLIQKKEFRKKARQVQTKRVYYLCMEFLVGRSLKNNLCNMNLQDEVAAILKEKGFELEKLYDYEPDPGLGNGGLGRLAACYMDALTSQDYLAEGFCIRYEYGLFKQKIVDGWQREMPDVWLPGGGVWLLCRNDFSFEVKFGGTVEESWQDERLKIKYNNYDSVEAVPYDLMISGADTDTANTLRLWRARDIENFDMVSFENGDYTKAMSESTSAELISKVLYPADKHIEGKTLRLKQQYFLVSASLQNIFRTHMINFGTIDNLSEKVAIHINDTHPVLIIPEMMRMLMDEYSYTWEKAFDMTTKTIAYTNHTIMVEALEKWSEELMRKNLPRIYVIIKELDKRFRVKLKERFHDRAHLVERMAILSGGMVNMPNMGILGSHSVNGVSALHSEILKTDVFGDFYEIWPDKFRNVTDGIAHRRWLCQANPALTALLDQCIGKEYKKNAQALKDFERYKNDSAVLQKLEGIKTGNKKRLVDLVQKRTGEKIDPYSVFVVQAKRLHEYKRQLLNVLRIITLYLELKEEPHKAMLPQTFLFAAKAAPGYEIAKEIIKLIYYISRDINHHPEIKEKLNVVFLENYCVTLAETLIPAVEISEQISLAGKEASGTGNMKMMINGALTIGTMDGANIEMYDAVGAENIFIFGMKEQEVYQLKQNGYNPQEYYFKNERLKRSVDFLQVGFAGQSFAHIAQYLLTGYGGAPDPYMCLADYEDYMAVHDVMSALYENREQWNQKSLMNIAAAGHFSADRSVRQYATDIWGIEPIK